MVRHDEDLLTNPVWHSLVGPLSGFVDTDSSKAWRRFDPEVSPFSAVEGTNEETWRNIAAEVGLEGFCGLFRAGIPQLDPGWEEHFRGVCLQMVAEQLIPGKPVELEILGPDASPEALELASLTEPGPFLSRTIEIGRYVGVRRRGQLIAMAGERFRVPGYVEISAVCTHPSARGEGLAAALTLEVARSIRAKGDEAFLHVLIENENAIRLYQKLGFVIRREVDVVFAQWHGPDWQQAAET